MSGVYDLVVIGGGPGGYVAAARAGSLGLKTALVEKDKLLGGTCLHRGCIPTKALLHAADIYSESKEATQFGITIESARVDWPQVQKYKNKVVSTNAAGVAHLMKSKNVDVFQGVGSLLGPTSIDISAKDVDHIKLETKNTLICVGSKPKELPFARFDKSRILSSDSIFELDKIPSSLTIIGGGAIGVEFASIFARFGTKVTILETLERIVEPADADCSKELERELKKQGIAIHVRVSVNDVSSQKGQVKTVFAKPDGTLSEIDSEYLLVAVGRNPVTDQIGLKYAQIESERGFIKVNDYLQSTQNNIYAIGDCINTPSLAHVASAEAICAVDYIAQKDAKLVDYNHVPSCVYTAPNIAWCGLTEEQAIEKGYDIKIGKFDFVRNSKAAILGKRKGFIKFVTDAKYGEILGVHIIGPQATELLAEPAFAMQIEATIDDIARSVHAHPTLYESLYEAAAIAIDRGVHG